MKPPDWTAWTMLLPTLINNNNNNNNNNREGCMTWIRCPLEVVNSHSNNERFAEFDTLMKRWHVACNKWL